MGDSSSQFLRRGTLLVWNTTTARSSENEQQSLNGGSENWKYSKITVLCVCSLYALNLLSCIYLLANSCSSAMKSLLKNVAQINICEQAYVWKSLPPPSHPLGYLQLLEQFFYHLMSAHVSFVHVLMCLNYVQNLNKRICAAFLSKDDPEKKSFGAISLCKHIFRLIATARCCMYILY